LPKKSGLFLSAVLLAATAFTQQTLAAKPAESWWKHVQVLADDKMEGRATGTEGLRKAQAYVVEQLQQAGLQPAGTDGFYQPMKFVTRKVVESESHVTLIRDGKPEAMKLGDDVYFSTRVDIEAVKAPLVFAGYGLRVPEYKIDDLSGLDLKGKVAVIITGSPAEVPNSMSAHYQSLSERWKAFKEAGALGIVSIPNPASFDVPWERLSRSRNVAQMDIEGAEFNNTEGWKLSLTWNPKNADKLFAGSGHTFAELSALAKERKPLPRFVLQAVIDASPKVERQHTESANVVAKVEGTDPQLKNEYVVISAHLDHLGIGEPVNGDKVYNGAIDNASGSALLLDIASKLMQQQTKLRRSVLFVFVTAEEKGLLGSKYFARHPSIPQEQIVANVNVDMFLPIVPLKVLRVLGLTDSDLGDRVTNIAQSVGVKVQQDFEPQRNLFVRSDQYSFIREGIPAIVMTVSYEPGSAEQKIFKTWLHDRYHAPSDDLQQPVNFEAAAKYEEIVRNLLINVANTEQRPDWKPDSFFKRFAKTPGATHQHGRD
jgi:Zn-dependent M28 family amino/carboxypeptidase